MVEHGGTWRATDEHGVVITVKGDCQAVVATIASSGTDELPVAITVHRADTLIDEVLVFPHPSDQQP